MSKSKHHHFIDTVYDCWGNGAKQGVFHLSTEDHIPLNGRIIKLHNKDVVNFGSCSYLGLEMDQRLKEGAIDAITKYGTQFSSSRAFLSCGLYEELEALCSKMFGAHAIVSPTTTLGHMSAIPTLVRDDDAVILDQQVHGSIQTTVQLLRPRGIHVEIIRHNRMDLLEEKIKELRNKYSRIWYMADGVYSMYGDYAPILEIEDLLNKYDQLRLYIDDAHGMSWEGKNGSGVVLSQVNLHSNMILATSLNKAFASGGGLLVFPKEEDMIKVRTCGGTFIFSGPVQPASLGAAIASAKIHLSDEIYLLQDNLRQKVSYCDELIRLKKIPYVLPSSSPIMYIGVGLPRMGYNMIKRIFNEGYYIDVGVYPAVAVKRSGIRLAITNHHTNDDIKNIIDAIDYHYPLALEEENESIRDISRYFYTNFEVSDEIKSKTKQQNTELEIVKYNSIKDVSKEIWDSLLGDRGSFDWNGCKFLEEAFSNNSEKENNWKFSYYMVYDKKGTIVLCTFFTELWVKDDLLSPDSVSMQVEEIRKSNPYFLTSKVLMMGSLLTVGDHLYINKKDSNWRGALQMLIENVREEQNKCEAAALQFRDFDNEDKELKDFMINQGFVRIDMPSIHTVENLNWEDETGYLNQLSYKSRRHHRVEIFPYRKYYNIEVISEVSEKELDQYYLLYENVKKRGFEFNTFKLPKKVLRNAIYDKNWEVLKFSIIDNEGEDKVVAVAFLYKSAKNYTPLFLGIDYSHNQEYKVYRQVLFQVLQRGRKLNVDKVYFGMGAHIEKKKFGSKVENLCMYLQLNDEFNSKILSTFMSVND